MIKSLSILEVKRGDRIYQLEVSVDSPLGEIYDVLCEMKSFLIKEMTTRAKQEIPQETPQEEPKEAV